MIETCPPNAHLPPITQRMRITFLFLLGSFLVVDANVPFPKQPGIWTYEGSLIDPMNGHVVARVVGLERVVLLTPPQEDCCCISRKVFCYTNDNNSKPLEFYRARSNGPQRRIPLDQAVVQSNARIRYLSPQHVLVTEFLDTGNVVVGKIEPDDSLWKIVTTPVKNFRIEDLKDDEKNPPPRQSWIQLGGSMKTNPKQQVRETYDYRHHGQLSYVRYGEGPVWYGPGRTAQLELTGRYYKEGAPIPPALVGHIPEDFWDNFETTEVCREVKRSWWTRLRAATQFTVGERQHYD